MRLVGLVGALIFLLLGGSGFEDCAAHERLTCDRSTGKPRCMLVAGELRSKTTVFEGDSLVAVRSVRHQGKGRPTYGVAVVDRAGVSHEVVRNVNELDAKRASEWLAGSDLDVAIDNPRYPLGMALAGGLILIGFGFALGALRRRRTLAAPPRDGSPPA